MPETLYASFADCNLAERAVGALLDYGARQEDISLIAHESHRNRLDPVDPDETTVLAVDPDEDPVLAAKHGISVTTPADAAAGAVKGAGIGAGVGAVLALAALVVPGVGLVAGAGALASALGAVAGTAAAGAVVGGLTGYLKEQGVPEEAAMDYNQAIERGGALIALHLPSGKVDRATAEALLLKYHAARVGAHGSTLM